ncbi:MAG: hypothetical protein ACE5LS_02740 [Thermoplasmata archaeon]
MKRHRGWLAIAITAAVVASTYVALTLPPAALGPVPGEGEFNYGETLIQGPLQYAPTYNPCMDDYRPTYGATCASLGSIFGTLPPVPADMADVSSRVFRNAQGFITMGRITESYWRNPEFYPGWSQTHFDDVYMTDRSDIVTPIGFGAYPSITQVVTRESTGVWTFTFFLKDGWGLTHWQGMVLDIYLPPTALRASFDAPLLDGAGDPVTQDTTIAAGMNPRFTFPNDSVYESFASDLLFPLEADQRMVVLEPNYPSFQPGWVRAITVDVDLGPLPPGTWFFLVKASLPTPEIGELYFYQHGNFYQPSGFGIVLFQGLIVVA